MIKDKLNSAEDLDEVKKIALNLFNENKILQEQVMTPSRTGGLIVNRSKRSVKSA